jgi:hypothetical protein
MKNLCNVDSNWKLLDFEFSAFCGFCDANLVIISNKMKIGKVAKKTIFENMDSTSMLMRAINETDITKTDNGKDACFLKIEKIPIE